MSRDGGLTKKRTLYTKAYGHTEWVTDVSHCPDGRVLSAGMDSKVCLWNASGQPKCMDLLGHTGSVAKVLASADSSLAISAGYDKSLRLWNLLNGKEIQCLRCHRAPVMHLSWAAGVLASADRDGSVVSWDTRTGDATHLGAHGGHATALAAASYAEPNVGAAGSASSSSAGCGGDAASKQARLEELTELLDSGLVNGEEYAEKRKAILAGGGGGGGESSRVDSSSTGLMPRGLLSGGHDGIVKLWDLRTRSSAMETRVHEGAVNDIIAHKLPSGSPIILTAGALASRLHLPPPRLRLLALARTCFGLLGLACTRFVALLHLLLLSPRLLSLHPRLPLLLSAQVPTAAYLPSTLACPSKPYSASKTSR